MTSIIPYQKTLALPASDANDSGIMQLPEEILDSIVRVFSISNARFIAAPDAYPAFVEEFRVNNKVLRKLALVNRTFARLASVFLQTHFQYRSLFTPVEPKQTPIIKRPPSPPSLDFARDSAFTRVENILSETSTRTSSLIRSLISTDSSSIKRSQWEELLRFQEQESLQFKNNARESLVSLLRPPIFREHPPEFTLPPFNLSNLQINLPDLKNIIVAKDV